MYMFPDVSVCKDGDGDLISNCSVCHSNNVSFVYTPSRLDTFFVLNKLFEVPVEHCVKQLEQQHSTVGGFVEQPSPGIQFKLCSSCENDVERAKCIYQQLVVAVRQFRDIQKKLVAAVKVGKVRCCEGKTDPRNLTDERFWSLFKTTAGFFNNFDEKAPFVVEDLKDVKLEHITESYQSAKLLWNDYEVTDEEENRVAASKSNDSVSLEPNNKDGQDAEYFNENSDASHESQMDTGCEESNKDFECFHSSNKSLEVTLKSEEEQFEQDAQAFESDFVVKEEFGSEVDEWNTDDDEKISVTAEDHAKSITSTQEVDEMEPVNGGKLSIHSDSEQNMSRKNGVKGKRLKNREAEQILTADCKKVDRRHNSDSSKERKVKYKEKINTTRSATAAFLTSKMESYECNLCSNTYKISSALTKHKRLIHGVNEPRKCPEEGCGMVFKTRKSLAKLRGHLSRCHGFEPTYKCSKCDEAFNTWNQKWRHEQKVHTKLSYICDLCGKGFACVDYLHSHRHYSHKQPNEMGQVSPRFACDSCGKSYKHKSNLSSHKKECQKNEKNSEQKKTSFICEECGKTYSSKLGLKAHTLQIHDPDKLKIACYLCEKKFLARRQLEIHLYHHHQVGPKECARQPYESGSLQCSVSGCRRRFRGEKSLENHIKKTHGEDGKKPGAFKCKFCGQTFYANWKLQRHEMVHENKLTKPFSCDVCGKGFPTPYHLHFHKKRNTHSSHNAKDNHGSKQLILPENESNK